jgi:predicted metal-dependent hydrolase
MELLKELINEQEYEDYGNGGNLEKSYKYKDHAKEHAGRFIEDARRILHHNKREGTKDEVEKLAMQAAKDYNEAIVKAIQKELGMEEDEYGTEENMGPEENMRPENEIGY